MRHRTIQLDEQPEALQRFIQQLGDQPVVMELGGKPMCVRYPSQELFYAPQGTRADAAGAWHLRADVLRTLSGEET
jgi:hypothetical protein